MMRIASRIGSHLGALGFTMSSLFKLETESIPVHEKKFFLTEQAICHYPVTEILFELGREKSLGLIF
jgi:hypothetical protein